MTSLAACPVCHHTHFSEFLNCRDFTVSHETFQLSKCAECGFLLTNPRPDDNRLAEYYQSPHYISHAAKSQGLLDRLYKLARSLTLRWKYRLIQNHSTKPVKTLLDVGCGTGTFLQHCTEKHLTTAGVEPASGARDIAIANTRAEIFSDLPDSTHQYDVITLWHVLEHISDLNATIEKLKALMEKNGTMFIAVPNHNSADAKKYKEYWAAYDVPRHLWHFTRPTMQRIMTNHGLKVVDILPMPLDAYYVALLSEKYLAGKNGVRTITRAILSGLKSNSAATKTQEYSSLIYIVRK